MEIKYPLARPDLRGNERRYLLECVREGGVSAVGRHVGEFEAACAAALGVPAALAVSHGTAALHLALTALDIGAGDEVIVPDLTYVATANVVRYTGAQPVLVDVSPSSWNLDPEKTARAITRRTRAVIAVHLFGNPADLGALRTLTRRHGIALIEDAAEAFGARWRDRAVGTIGDVGCFSFFGNKVVTTGEGGLVVTRSPALRAKLRHLRDQAKSPRRPYFHDRLAFTYRISALQAAVGLAQLERLPEFLLRRAHIARWYIDELNQLEGWSRPLAAPPAEPITWLFSLRRHGWTAALRDRALRRMRRLGIDARPVFQPMSQLPMYRARRPPVSSRIWSEAICLPTYVGLRRSDVRYIAAALKSVWGSHARG
jgi:perosamine synthetase